MSESLFNLKKGLLATAGLLVAGGLYSYYTSSKRAAKPSGGSCCAEKKSCCASEAPAEESKSCCNRLKDPQSIHSADDLLAKAQDLYHDRFQSAPLLVGVAPGRVNLIGEHTDYSDGFVCPMAIERVTYVIGKKNNLNKFRLFSANRTEAEGCYVEYSPSELTQKPAKKSWDNYFRGVVAEYEKAGHSIPCFDALIIGNVPLGGGLSSSASLEVATASFLDAILGVETEAKEKALRCQSAEHKFAGVPCGIMDQFISSAAKKDCAMLLDCRSYTPTFVPFVDPSVAVLITNSNVRHELTGGEYAKRRQQCEAAVKVLASRYPDIKALRDAKLDDLVEVTKDMDAVVYRRARHVISENQRTEHAAQALARNDYVQVGTLMKESHWSLQHDFEVSCDELDILVEIANRCPGVFGSRMTGGGFGGCTVTLVQAEKVQAVIDALKTEYTARTRLEPSFMITRPAEGTRHFQLLVDEIDSSVAAV